MSDSNNAGTARASYVLDISSVEAGAQKIRDLLNGIKKDALLAGAGAGPRAITPPTGSPADQARIASAIERRANIEARLAQVQNAGRNSLEGLTQAEQIYSAALEKVAQDSDAALRLQTQLQATQNRIAAQSGGGLPVLPRTVESFGADALDQVKSGLLGIVGPAALVTAGFGAARAAVGSFVDAFKFKAELDATNLAIRTQLGEVRDASQAFAEANAFADRYRLTQADTAAAIQASIPILRSSNASLTDVESTLLRLQAKKPEKSIADAARALDELKSGQIVSIVDQFNVSREAANKMKDEINHGGDAVKVLSDYLTSAGIGMSVLENRTKGAQGALNDLQKAQENLKIAQADFAAGPGVTFLNEEIRVITGLTRVLGGSGGLVGAAQSAQHAVAAVTPHVDRVKFSLDRLLVPGRLFGDLFGQGSAEVEASTVRLDAAFDDVRSAIGRAQVVADGYAQSNRLGGAFDDERRAAAQLQIAIGAGITDLQRSADASTLDAAQKKAQANQIAILNENTRASLNTFLALNPTLDASGAAAAAAAQGYKPIIGQLAAIRLQADGAAASLAQLQAQQAGIAGIQKSLAGAGSSVTTPFAKGAGGIVAGFDRAQSAAEKLLDSEIQLASAKGNTARQVELLRQKERLYAGDQAERNAIEAQIIGLQGKNRVSAAQTTALQLNNVEQDSGLQLLRTQRENNERLADAQQDFDLHRTRSQEDEDVKLRRLLASGQRGAAQREREDFARDQTRAAEDFNLQRTRTLRNNAEATGDIDARTGLRTSQIGDRAALHGVRAGGVPNLPGAPTFVPDLPQTSAAPRIIQIVINSRVDLDGKTVGQLIYEAGLREQIDEDVALALLSVPPPGGDQTAVAGGRP